MTEPNRPFADWEALVGYVRGAWKLEAIAEDGEWIERQWDWTDPERSQLVTVARVNHEGEVWVSWSAAIADADAMTDAQIIEATAAEVGRIIRDEGCCWLEQHVPLAQLTPRLLERLSDSFAERADNLELDVTGGDRD
jgi:hypothetical protein